MEKKKSFHAPIKFPVALRFEQNWKTFVSFVRMSWSCRSRFIPQAYVKPVENIQNMPCRNPFGSMGTRSERPWETYSSDSFQNIDMLC